jgi:delta-1-pyrroline-5-carboxylate synthetase
MLQIASLAKSIRTLANMEDPINQILKRTEVTAYKLLTKEKLTYFIPKTNVTSARVLFQVAEDLVLEKTSCPLGVLLIVFESRPDALVQVVFNHKIFSYFSPCEMFMLNT